MARALVVVLLLEAAHDLVRSEAGRHGKAAHIIGLSAVQRCNEVGEGTTGVRCPWHALLAQHQKETLNNDRYVVVLTGRRD